MSAGLPADFVRRRWIHVPTPSLRASVTSLQPEHFSLYGLEFKGGTPMTKDLRAGRLPTPDDDLAADMYELATSYLAGAGFDQYEISNWSKAGYECRHNLQYWRNLPYPGFGPGAHGYRPHRMAS